METPPYIYGIDDRPPFHYGLLYGLQWAFITFPAVIIAATLCGAALNLGLAESIRFLRLALLTTGLFTLLQTLWGHRYPLVDGPSTAVVLTVILLAPQGLAAIQGGMILGGMLLILIVLSRQLERIFRLFTPNVVGVILMLIALGLLPPLLKMLTGIDEGHPQGESPILLISLGLIFLIAVLNGRLKGFLKTVSMLVGMMAGSLVFLFLGRLGWQGVATASWVSFSTRWIVSVPGITWPAAVGFACAYLAVIVNTLGSLQGVAAMTDESRLPGAMGRGILLNGVEGITCGLLGVVGATVSFSFSPGVILLNRVASRFVLSYCGMILVLAAFLPKLTALLALVPAPVVGAALCVAMGGQIGAGMEIIASKKIASRDYFVVGLPLLLGTLVGFFPSGLMESLPDFSRVFLGNSLIVGIVSVLLMEHLIYPRAED